MADRRNKKTIEIVGPFADLQKRQRLHRALLESLIVKKPQDFQEVTALRLQTRPFVLEANGKFPNVMQGSQNTQPVDMLFG
jgi:hypothetical protein